jgi:hypothetical protein
MGLPKSGPKMRRFLGPIMVLLAAVLVGKWAATDHSAHASFPLRTDGAETVSPAFKGQTGLYLITLEMDAIQDRHHTSCLMGGDLLPYPAPGGTIGTSGCEVAPRYAGHWRLYRGGQLVAEDGPQSMRGAEPFVRQTATKGRLERELGTIELVGSQSYQLRVREVDAPPVLAGTNPVIHVRLHPWDVKNGIGRMLGGLLLALLLGIAGLVWLGRAMSRQRA